MLLSKVANFFGPNIAELCEKSNAQTDHLLQQGAAISKLLQSFNAQQKHSLLNLNILLVPLLLNLLVPRWSNQLLKKFNLLFCILLYQQVKVVWITLKSFLKKKKLMKPFLKMQLTIS